MAPDGRGCAHPRNSRTRVPFTDFTDMPLSHHSAALDSPRYTRTAMLLHWLLGIALVTVFGVGLYMADLPFSPQRLKL